jgi:hypothetical protein
MAGIYRDHYGYFEGLQACETLFLGLSPGLSLGSDLREDLQVARVALWV